MKKSRNLRLSYPVFTVLLIIINMYVFAQQRNITGYVRNVNMQAIEGASVVQKGANQGARTDANGSFSLQARVGSVLTISYVGYVSQDITVSEMTTYQIKLSADEEALDEVVVIGYGTARKRDLTGALASVGSDAMKDKPVANIGEALQGRASGVQIVNSGAPGSNVSIQIRGLGSINNSSPLVVIDGIPTDLALNALNPNDIETVDILKDASATAIYGSRGANGVLLISTKKGNKNKGSIAASINFATQQATSMPKMLNARQFASLHNEMMMNNNNLQRPDFTDPSIWGDGTSWIDTLLRNDKLSNYSVAYSGGSDKSTYYHDLD